MSVEVSIITPCFNSAQFIDAAIRSAISQTYTNWEMIIVDDCSRDDSFRIAKKYSNHDSRISVVKFGKRSGPAAARNAAIEKAAGRYIAFLDSDDIWLPEKLEKQIHLMHRNSIPFSYTAYEKIDVSGRRCGRFVYVPESGCYNNLLSGCFIGCSTAVYDVDMVGKLYMPPLMRAQDYGLWLNILRSGHIALGINQILALYRERPGSLSSSKLRKAYYQWRIYRNLEKISMAKTVKLFCQYGVKGIHKKMI